MISAITIFYATCFLLVNGIFVDFVESEFLETQNSRTKFASSWDTDRSRRSLTETIPPRLKIKVKYAMEKEIEINWYIRKPQYLVNEHLPVIMPLADMDPNVMKNVGKFVLYHDILECSAVVYFEKLNALYGVIGTDYYIMGLPFNFNEKGEYQLDLLVEGPYLQKRQPSDHIFPGMIPPPPSDTDAWKDYIRGPNQNLDECRKRPAECKPGPSTKIQRTNQCGDRNVDDQLRDVEQYLISTFNTVDNKVKHQDYYSETLVFVTRDLAEIFKQRHGNDHYIEEIIRYHIVYFNSVDMIFQKLQLAMIGLYINIAKIIIEDELIPFNFMSDQELQFSEVVAKLPNYMKSFPGGYPPDSFDHVFISTSRTIFDDDFVVDGMTKYGGDLYEARKNNEFYTVVPITMMRFQNFYADYSFAVHQIGRTWNIKIEPHENGLTSVGQCHGIMQREGVKCINCLKWNSDNRKQIRDFLNKNKNRCFLMNQPRSVRQPGLSRFTTSNRQCHCFGYHSAVLPKEIGIGGCDIPLRCEKIIDGKIYRENTVRPFDGTACTGRKVCWERKCQLITPK